MDEDTLRAIEAPLRRLFASKHDDDDNDDDNSDDPAPPLLHKIVQINFVAPCHRHQAEESQSSYRTITLSLSVDPKPGCGGIAWPAGEVGQ
jgi:hypothetical protein